MSIFCTIIICSLCICIFIAHSYYTRGLRPTINFFFFAFLVAIIKEGPMRISGKLIKNPAMPYEFLNKDIPEAACTVLAILGWVFTFYLGWYVAHRIARRLGSWGDRIFPVVFLSGIVTASIGYSIEATAMGLGWWRWTIEDVRFSAYLVGVPLIVFETWIHFPTQYLLMPYSLIECSRFRTAPWKGIFFAIPFVHSITTQVFSETLRVTTEYLALLALIVLAFASPLSFDYSVVKLPVNRIFLKLKLLEQAPLFVMAMLLFILLFLDLFKIHNPELLISLLPLALLSLSVIETIPFLFVVFSAVLLLLILQKLAIPAVIPIVIISIFKVLSRIRFEVKRKS